MAGPGIFWLGSSSREIASTRQLLSEMSKPGVVDELGYLVLQTAFAERLYPGVTTIMTRARYLVFVAAIYRQLERPSMLGGRSADRVARDLQDQLRLALMENEREGVIGRVGGRDIARLPSTVYWNALSALGIARQDVSESSYLDRVGRGGGGGTIKDDDDALHLDDAESLWDSKWRTHHIHDGKTFASRLSFALTTGEARELQARYARLPRSGGESMLTRLVTWGAQQGRLPDIGQVWEVPELPPELEVIVRHARCLSLFARGTVIQYQQLLVEKRGDADPGLRAAFEAWWREAAQLRDWKLTDFFAIAQRLDGVRSRDAQFFTDWLDCVRSAPSARSMFESTRARAIIAARERHSRPGKARLVSPFHLEKWGGAGQVRPGQNYHLAFRHPTGFSFAHDIVNALVRGEAT